MAESLIIRIGANAKEFDNELKKLKDKTASLEKGLASVAKVSAVAFTGLATAIGVATSKFTSFEKTFTNVQTLLDKSSFSTKTLSRGIADLRNDIIKLGSSTGESFENLNQGLFDLISAGVPAEEATRALTDAVNLATAGATDTATSVKALTAAYTAYGEAAGDSTDVAEKFFTAQKFGVTTVGELASEFNKVGGLANQLKIGFNEALAASTALTANGAKPTSQAFTEFRAVLNSVILAQGRLKNESTEVQNALSLQNIESKGIVAALQELDAATGGNVVTLQRLLGSSEALSGALALSGKQASTFSTILSELNDEQARAASFNDALATKQETTEKSLARLSQSFNAVAIQLGERFAPLINRVADGLAAIAQRFNELSDEQKDSIANFIKAGAAIAAVVTGLGTFALATIKVVRFIKTLRVVLLGARVAAAAFTGAFTLGLGTIIAFLPEIISGVKTLFGLFSDNDDEPKTLTNINKELDELKKKQELISKSGLPDATKDERIAGIDEEIKKLEELRQAKIKSTEGFGTGELLVRPEADTSGDPLAGLDQQLAGAQVSVPLRTEAQDKAAQEEIEAEKKKEAAKKEVRDQATQERIAAARAEQELLKAERDNVSKEEIDFIKRRNDLIAEEQAARQIKDNELRQTELENLKLQKEALLEEERAFQERRAEELAIARENEKALQEELRELDKEERMALREEDLEELRNQLLTEQEAKRQVARENAEFEIQRRNQFLKDEQKFGTAVATLNKNLNSKEVEGARSAAGQLVALQRSKNSTLKSIGKAAAITQITIDTAKGATSAYASLAPIPLIGPTLGLAAAASLIAFGAERIGQVSSAQRGGFVPPAQGGARDRVPALLQPGELVVPQPLVPNFIQSAGNPANADFAGGDPTASEDDSSRVIRLEGDLVQNEEFVAALATQLRESQEFENTRA